MPRPSHPSRTMIRLGQKTSAFIDATNRASKWINR